MKSQPLVTIAVPLLDEAARLPGLLAAIQAQDYPAQNIRLVLVDGGSQDGSRQLAEKAAAENPHTTVLDNPRRLAAAGLNLALAHAEGEIFLRLDARTRPSPQYVSACILALQTGGTDGFLAGVAGPQLAVGESPAARIHALALNHPFGAGGPAYRRAARPQESETIYLGAYRVEWLRRLGGWDEAFAANEDYELNTRLREAGGRLLVDPAISCRYLARDSLRQLARQYFRYGVWRTATIRRHHRAWRWRHLAPALLTAAIAIAVLLIPCSPLPLAALAAVYLGLDCVASLSLALRHGPGALPRLFVVFPILHLSWGVGFWLGMVRPPSA